MKWEQVRYCRATMKKSTAVFWCVWWEDSVSGGQWRATPHDETPEGQRTKTFSRYQLQRLLREAEDRLEAMAS